MSASGEPAATAPAFERLNAFFDHVFVITIERNANRRELLESNLRGLEFSYVDGVDGSRVPESELGAEYDDDRAQVAYGRSLSPGQIGCALSHRKAYRAMLEEQYDRVLILEDDASFPPESADVVGPALTQLPADWDLLYFYAQRSGESRWLDAKVRWLYPFLDRTGLRRYDLQAVRATYSRPYSRNLRIAGQHWMALAYAITRRTAAQLAEQQTPIVTVADDVLRRFSAREETRVFLTAPHVFLPRSGVDSTIWNRPQRQDLQQTTWG